MHVSFGSDVSIVFIYTYTALHTEFVWLATVISTYIQHQPTNLYCMGINSLAMVYHTVQKQNKCWRCKYLSCKLVQNTFSTLKKIQNSAHLDSTHTWCFWTKRWCLITRWPTCLPLYLNPLQDICMNTKMWAKIPDHGSITFTVIHAYRKFIAKKNKWLGQCIHSKR